MSGPGLRNPTESLRAFGAGLDITAADWAAREELEQLTYTSTDLSRELATSLTWECMVALRNAYGDALTCQFRLGDLVMLDIAAGLTQQALQDFREQIQPSPTVGFDFRLDKARLVQRWLGAVPGCRLLLYLFPTALQSFLASGLGQLESRLWSAETARKVILLVPDHEIWLNGSYLAVLGGQRIDGWGEVIPQSPPDATRPQRMYTTCRDALKWQHAWLVHLTPLHLQLDGPLRPEDPIANALRVHLANLIILYTADRTIVRPDGQWLAIYAGAKHSVELGLSDPQHLLGEATAAGVGAFMQMLEWAYDPQWATDRLPFVQIGVAQALQAAEPAVRYRLLLHNAGHIFTSLQWYWKAFLERKVDTYMSQVQALEDYVASTVQGFTDQVSTMIKSLSDTMLAAVGALLGSFIAALFKEKFNPTIFVIGMLVYAFYVLVFPLGYQMLHQWQRYRKLIKDFEIRCERFGERLYPTKVQEIVGGQVVQSQKHFRRWFGATLLAYVAVISVALMTVVYVPGQTVWQTVWWKSVQFLTSLLSELPRVK